MVSSLPETVHLPLIALLKRNVDSDVDQLNIELAGKSYTTAGLSRELQIPFSGNPRVLTPRNCIVLLGINPVHQSDRYSASEYPAMRRHIGALRANENGALENFYTFRGSYFSDGS